MEPTSDAPMEHRLGEWLVSSFLLCYCRDMDYPYPTGPGLGLLSVGTFLEERGVEIDYYDERIHHRERFLHLLEANPSAVGFSVMGGRQILSSLDLSREVKMRRPKTPVVWGGFFPTMAPEVVLRSGCVDLVVLGEGEWTALEIAGLLGEGRSLGGADLPGTAFLDEEGDLHFGPLRQPGELSTLPFSYRGKAADVLRSFMPWIRGPTREKPGIELSRGCPGSCSFCYNRVLGTGARPRRKEAEQIRNELSLLRELGIDFVDIYDDTLAAGDPDAIRGAIGALREKGLAWYGNMRLDLLSKRLVQDMASSRCRWLFFGIESMDDAVLRRLGKGFSTREIRTGIGILSRSSIPVTYSLLFRVPLEAESSPSDEREELERLLDFTEEIHRTHPAAEIQIQSFVPLPGTALWETAMARGYERPVSLEDFSRWDHLRIRTPSSIDEALASKLYLTSFLAYRGRRHFPSPLMVPIVLPLEKLSRLRIRRRFFDLFVEGRIIEAARRAGRLGQRLGDLSFASSFLERRK